MNILSAAGKPASLPQSENQSFEMPEKEHFVFLDVLRFLAICLVIYTHSGSIGLFSYENDVLTASYWPNLLLLPFSQVSVNLFFMISGALLLPRKDSYRKIFTRKLPRILAASLLAVLIQYLYACYKVGVPFSILQTVKSLYAGGIVSQHWFLYAYMSLLLILPILQKLADILSDREYFYLFSLMIILKGFCPLFEAIADWDAVGIAISLLDYPVFYLLMGYFVKERCRKYLTRRNCLFCFFLCLGTALFNALLNHHSFTAGGVMAYWELFTPIYAGSIFFCTFYLFRPGKQIPGFCLKLFPFLGSGVFGTYLLESVIRETTLPLYTSVAGENCFFPLLLVWILAVVLLGIVISNLLKLLPGFKQIL